MDFKNERFSSKWPDEEIPDYARLGSWRKEIKDIIAWANDKKSWLLERPRPRVKPATDYRYALVWDLLEIYVAVTGRKPKRASYNRRSKESQIHGEFPQFIRKAATPLIGRHANLDHQIQLAKQKFSEMKKNKGVEITIIVRELLYRWVIRAPAAVRRASISHFGLCRSG